MSTQVHHYQIIGTPSWVFQAWEPYAGHSSITFLDGRMMGQVGTRPLPAEIDALPAMTEQRSAAVRAWHEAQYTEAHAAIVQSGLLAGFVEDRRIMGEIVCHCPRKSIR